MPPRKKVENINTEVTSNAARSRRVQAQRKFAQGAYVPPNTVAVAAADNRRDAAQDPRNVTMNNMTATGLLDVVSLQSAATSPDRNGHSHLTSQPVVIIERLRGSNLTRDVQPGPSQREMLEARPWEYPHERVNNNVATIKKPAEPPMLQTVKIKKEYKRDHPMALRYRRPSKLELNRLIAETSAPSRKVASKRKKNSSDEDEPLIFQKTRLKQAAEQLSISKQTAARDSTPKEKSPKNKPCKKRSKKEITTNEVTTHETTTKEITTNEVTTHETTTKEITTSKTTTKKIITNEICLKETDRKNTKQSIARKTPMKRTRQKRIHKKCSPKQPAHVAPGCSVPKSSIPDFTITVMKEELTDETIIQNDKADLGTPNESVIEIVPNDPIFPEVLDNLVAPVVPVTTDDLVIPPVQALPDFAGVPFLDSFVEAGGSLDKVLSNLDEVFEEEGIDYRKHDYEAMDKVQKSPKPVTTFLHIIPKSKERFPEGRPDDKPMIKNHVPEVPVDKPLSLHDAPMANNDLNVQMANVQVPEDTGDEPNKDNIPEDTSDSDVSLAREDMMDSPMPENCISEDPVDESSLHDAPAMTNIRVPEDTGDEPNNDNTPEDTSASDVSLAREDMMDSPIPENCVPEDPVDESSLHDAPPMTNIHIPEDTGDEPNNDNTPEDTNDCDVSLAREDGMDSAIPENCVPEDPVDESSLHDAPPMTNIRVPEDTGDEPNNDYIPEDTSDCDVSLAREDMMDSPIPENCVPEDPVDESSLHDAPPMTNIRVPENTGDEPNNDNTPEDTSASDVSLAREDMMDLPIPENCVPEDPVDESSLHDAPPMTNIHISEDTGDEPNNDNTPEDTSDCDVSLAREDGMDSAIPENCVPEDPVDESSFHDAPPMTNIRVPEDTGDEPNNDNIPEDTSDCDVSLAREDGMDSPITNLRIASPDPEAPTPCAAAACRSDKDVINASKEFLDSRCKVCKPCIRIDKLMKVSALLESQIGLSNKGRQNKTAVQEKEPTEREGETEEVELEKDYEDAKSTNEDPGNIYLLLPNQSSLMMKSRANVVHGKEVLGVGLVPKNESLINKEFSLEEREHLLDQIIESLTVYPDVNFEGRDVNLVCRDVNLEDREVNLEVRHDNIEGRNDNLERQNDIPDILSISSDSTAEMSDSTTEDEKTPTRLTAEKRRLKRMAVKKKLAMMRERMRKEKEREIARVEEEKRQEISRIMAEQSNVVSQMSRQYRECVTHFEKEKLRGYALLTEKVTQDVISKIKADKFVDGMAANLDKEMDAKKMDLDELLDQEAPGTSSSILPTDGGLLVEAPVYHPTEEDFLDPVRFYEKIWPEAVRFGICKVVPPPGWKPPFRVHDEMRFEVTNQYISRLFNRWGSAARELCAIKLSLAQQKVNFTRPPLLDGIEVNLPKLYHLVQRHGGLETVYNKKRWGKVAEDMKFNKGPNTERKLDQIYVKYLLPYDTLSHQERQDIMRKVEIAWNRKNQKLLDRALNPLNRQQRLLGLIDSSDDETEDEDTAAAVNEAEDCIIKGAVMNRAKFRKIATMTYENTFGQGSEAADPPDLDKIEEYYWRLVTLGTEHVCVHAANVDTGEEGYGFIKNKSDSYGRHPWNPKMVSQNPRNVLKYLGPVLGATVPTLLLGMLFSTSCWHKDPHVVAWLEILLLGPEKIWYGIPADQADKFRKAVETLCPTSCQNKFHWLSTDITMIPPNLLREHNVTLSRITQREGEYILAFPNAYTCCISTGYTESESVYFAPPSWLENLWTVFKEARQSCEPTMFPMEHLLYNIGKDPKVDPAILKSAQPLFDKMLREEVTNRQMLQERGLPFVQELLSATSSRRKNTAHPFNPRDQDECEYCRATLYLSKVIGLTGRNTVLCLEHALKLLDAEKYKDTNIDQLKVLVHVSVKELNNVHDDMKRRLGIPND